MTILQKLRAALRPWPLRVLRLFVLLVLARELYVTGAIQRRDMLHPSNIGTDTSTYYAAGLRLNAGHSLYGPLQPDDRRVPGYPSVLPAPLLSPPLVGVLWRPLAILPGALPMDLWWFCGFALVTGLTVAFAILGKPRNVIVLLAVLGLGLPLRLLVSRHYPYPGYDSPVSFAALSGNLNASLTALFALTWWATSRGRPWVAGASAALATALKLGPLVLLWWFVTQRSWRSVRAFIVAAAALGAVGVVFAGVQANLDFVHIAFGGGVKPTTWSVVGVLHRLFNVPTDALQYATIAAIVVGLAAIVLLRNHPRAAFTAAILTTIYGSPVVLQGNFALLVAVAAPWVLPHAAKTIEPSIADGASAEADRVAGTPGRDSFLANRSAVPPSPASSAICGDQRSIRWILSMFTTRCRMLSTSRRQRVSTSADGPTAAPIIRASSITMVSVPVPMLSTSPSPRGRTAARRVASTAWSTEAKLRVCIP